MVPKARARALWRTLLASGFVRTRARSHPHQLEALVDRYGAVVEIHAHLPGVFAAPGRLATADELIARQLVTDTNNSIFVPRREVLVAHAIAHALLQNRATPQAYSPLRMLADLVDLRKVEPDAVQRSATYLAPELEATCSSLERLCESLSNGLFSGAGFNGTSEQILLWHCIAARVDTAYAERLRAAGLLNKFRDGSSAAEIAGYVAGVVFPAEVELDVLYGPAIGPVARLIRRLRRPIDVTMRAASRWARWR